MTNKIFRLVVVFVLFSSFGFSAVETNSPKNEATNKVRFIKGNGDKSNYIKMYYNLYADLNLSEKEAIAIAEIILVKIYGERVLKQRPWIVSDKGDFYKINGTFHHPKSEDGSIVVACGGVAEIEIDKRNGAVRHFMHGK